MSVLLLEVLLRSLVGAPCAPCLECLGSEILFTLCPNPAVPWGLCSPIPGVSTMLSVPVCVPLVVPCKAHKDKALGAGASPVPPGRCLTEFSVVISYSPCPGLGRVRGAWLLTPAGCLVMGSEEVQAVQKHWHSSLLHPAKVNYCKNGAELPFPLFNRLFLETAISTKTGFPLIRQLFALIF